MLVLRREQLEAFAEERRRDFERRVQAHLQRTQPELHDALGEEVVLESIRWGIARALEHGLDGEYDIVRYIDAMYALGPEFDVDPELPWAADALADPELPPRARMDVITWRTQELEERIERERAERERAEGER